jgi:D-glycero-alpha-D-manno-heptose-7-phosphate kinase
MIISRTPYRISFFGGGTDYPDWYLKNGGQVLSTTINKYCYITCRYLPPFFSHKHRIVYSQIENVKYLDEINHPAVREVLKDFKINKGLEIHHDGDLPAKSGLGSSSSFTVGLVHALSALLNISITKKKLALKALEIEQSILKEKVGSQDQIAAAYGGLNFIKFNKNSSFSVSPLIISKSKKNDLEKHIILCFTGISRLAPAIASEKLSNIANKTEKFERLSYFTEEGVKILNSTKFTIKDFGKLLTESWKVKKSLASVVSNSRIDEIFNEGLENQAIGGKLLGAGAGGFLMFIVPPNKRDFFMKHMKKYICLPIKFDVEGSFILNTKK